MSNPAPDWKVIWTDLIANVSGWFFRTWLLMLLFGVLHAEVASVPTFGFWQCLFISGVFESMVGGGIFQTTQRVKSLTPGYAKKTDPLSTLLEALKKTGRASNPSAFK